MVLREKLRRPFLKFDNYCSSFRENRIVNCKEAAMFVQWYASDFVIVNVTIIFMRRKIIPCILSAQCLSHNPLPPLPSTKKLRVVASSGKEEFWD